MPAPTAPLVTSVTRMPRSCRAANWLDDVGDDRRVSSRPSSPVSTAVPTLTTMQRTLAHQLFTKRGAGQAGQ